MNEDDNMRRVVRIIAGAVLGAVLAFGVLGAVYNQFSPGGALSGTWNSQSVALDSGAFITGVLPSSNGGTGTAFFAVNGPATSTKTFSFPNASTTVLTTNAAVTLGQGGTGLTSASDDTTIVSSGSAWVATSVPNCGDSTHALAYSTSTNAYACQSITGTGVTQTSSTFTATWVTGCSNDPAGTITYVQTGNVVTLVPTQAVSCTSDATAMSTAAGDLPAAIRPARQTQLKYTSLQINGTDTDACITLQPDGTLQWHTSGACGTNPGNVSKSIVVGNQTPLTYTLN